MSCIFYNIEHILKNIHDGNNWKTRVVISTNDESRVDLIKCWSSLRNVMNSPILYIFDSRGDFYSDIVICIRFHMSIMIFLIDTYIIVCDKLQVFIFWHLSGLDKKNRQPIYVIKIVHVEVLESIIQCHRPKEQGKNRGYFNRTVANQCLSIHLIFPLQFVHLSQQFHENLSH